MHWSFALKFSSEVLRSKFNALKFSNEVWRWKFNVEVQWTDIQNQISMHGWAHCDHSCGCPGMITGIAGTGTLTRRRIQAKTGKGTSQRVKQGLPHWFTNWQKKEKITLKKEYSNAFWGGRRWATYARPKHVTAILKKIQRELVWNACRGTSSWRWATYAKPKHVKRLQSKHSKTESNQSIKRLRQSLKTLRKPVQHPSWAIRASIFSFGPVHTLSQKTL